MDNIISAKAMTGRNRLEIDVTETAILVRYEDGWYTMPGDSVMLLGPFETKEAAEIESELLVKKWRENNVE